jgi:hypothetical protein
MTQPVTCTCGGALTLRPTSYGASWIHPETGATLCADGSWPKPVAHPIHA